MRKEPIHLALAVNNAGNFEAKHFGDADKYEFYRWTDDNLVFINEQLNPFAEFDENHEHEHGSQKKGKAITNFLKSAGTEVLVSRQFGKNIHVVSKHFIPVLVPGETKENILGLLKKNMEWIKNELNGDAEKYNYLRLKNVQ